jgi:hypothetical protein
LESEVGAFSVEVGERWKIGTTERAIRGVVVGSGEAVATERMTARRSDWVDEELNTDLTLAFRLNVAEEGGGNSREGDFELYVRLVVHLLKFFVFLLLLLIVIDDRCFGQPPSLLRYLDRLVTRLVLVSSFPVVFAFRNFLSSSAASTTVTRHPRH